MGVTDGPLGSQVPGVGGQSSVECLLPSRPAGFASVGLWASQEAGLPGSDPAVFLFREPGAVRGTSGAAAWAGQAFVAHVVGRGLHRPASCRLDAHAWQAAHFVSSALVVCEATAEEEDAGPASLQVRGATDEASLALLKAPSVWGVSPEVAAQDGAF